MGAKTNHDKFKSDGSLAGNALEWVDARFPAMSLWRDHLAEYYAPKNFNFWYYFGSLAIVVLAIQLITGIFLVMFYKPDASLNAAGVPVAFASVEYIMRDVNFGWIIRYMHSTGASAFFIVVYLHMFRGMMYGSYRKPRELIWIFGTLIYLVLMAEAFMGYLLPWGQMSFWGAQVIVNLFSAIPLIGEPLSIWIRGDYVIGDATLNRFFSFHVIAIPFALVGLVVAHIMALHEVGSSNPDGIEIKDKVDDKGIPLDGIPFHPYYTVKDIVGVVVFLMVFFGIVFFAPEGGGYFLEYNNFFPADPLKTPPHIAPVWYFTPSYSILRSVTSDFVIVLQVCVAGLWLWLVRGTSDVKQVIITLAAVAIIVGMWAIDAKFWGVVAMGTSVLIIGFLPWLDRSPVRSIRYRGPIYKGFLTAFVIAFLTLGYLGTQPPSAIGGLVAQFFSLVYFAFFFLMPWYTKIDKCKPVPERVVYK
ncbi:cytochrome b [Propionivibrio soli]|uniref:cytochrome b n=1 Tax=Propionivibrio soli TaxID=2976531 RepID=UPI0021E89C74|nr:cytochrome bc complex cytochrome b subunit [Propionivibrio soli]